MLYFLHYVIDFIRSGSAFWFCALTGSALFIIQLLINFLGGSSESGFDTIDTPEINGESSDLTKFRWLSLQAFSGFLMMFGWVALTCRNQFGFQNISTLAIALTGGFFAAFVIRLIFRWAAKLQSSGNSYRIEDAMGKEAYVYQSIPQGGMGKVSVSLECFTHEIDAISHHSEELSSFTRVKIIDTKDGNTVVVALL